MSELTSCNYCTLQRMKLRAAERGVDLVIEEDDGWITARYSDQAKPSAHFKALSDSCVC